MPVREHGRYRLFATQKYAWRNMWRRFQPTAAKMEDEAMTCLILLLRYCFDWRATSGAVSPDYDRAVKEETIANAQKESRKRSIKSAKRLWPRQTKSRETAQSRRQEEEGEKRFRQQTKSARIICWFTKDENEYQQS